MEEQTANGNSEKTPDFRILPLVYAQPDMREVTRLSDITYKTLEDGTELKLDVYYPDTYDGQALLPAVLFVHGDAAPEILKNAKDWACYIGWGELIASTGLAAVTFNHRPTETLQKAYQSIADVDDLIQYVRAHSHDLGIDPERLGIWTCSAGSYRGLRAAMRGSPAYMRCAVSYYGLVNPGVFAEPEDTPEASAELDATTYLRQERTIPPLLIVRAGLDNAALNAGIDDFLQVAIQRKLDVDFMNHANGHHGFDVLDNNERSREIIRATLEFIKTHLSAQSEE